MIELPFETTLIILVAASSAGLAALTLFFMLLNRARRAIKRIRFQQVKRISVPKHMVRFTATVLWLTGSLAAFFLVAFVQSFQNFTKEELVAEIHCYELPEAPGTMKLEFTPIMDGQPRAMRTFHLSGDQWALEGNILKWDNWMNFAGLHTMFKLTRVRGRYVDIDLERHNSRSVFSLVQKEDDPKWRWLYKYGYRLRFVEAVYGNTVYTYPTEDQIYQVFVTTSGFSLKVKRNRS